jgi:hypothetical protein
LAPASRGWHAASFPIQVATSDVPLGLTTEPVTCQLTWSLPSCSSDIRLTAGVAPCRRYEVFQPRRFEMFPDQLATALTSRL